MQPWEVFYDAKGTTVVMHDQWKSEIRLLDCTLMLLDYTRLIFVLSKIPNIDLDWSNEEFPLSDLTSLTLDRANILNTVG